jgi:hypothetical protein
VQAVQRAERVSDEHEPTRGDSGAQAVSVGPEYLLGMLAVFVVVAMIRLSR